MKPDDLIAFHDQRPFRPFAIHLSDGRSFRVEHPEFLSRSPDATTLLYWFDLARREEIDITHVTSVERLPIEANGRRKKKK